MMSMTLAKERCQQVAGYVWTSVSRTKSLDVNRLADTELKRCLNVVDLTALGVGSTLGAGIYVITGQVAKSQAGPAVVLSFLIAAVASLLAGVCYAELASRVPRAGSAYIYSYVAVGEMWAFVIGWNMILENMIGAASVGKAWSEYLDSMLNDTIKKSIVENLGGFHSEGLAEYPDFLAFVLLIFVTLLVSLGVKMSSMLSFVFTMINLMVIICIVIIGIFYVDGNNWTEKPGFFPYGFTGVLSGAATCFYAFVGFDTIATSGEEAQKPSKNIPKAIVATLVVCFCAYFSVSAIMTLMVHFSDLADAAALPKIFVQRGIWGAEYIIGIGGMCGLTAAMLGSIFPLPRTIYAMAQDGLIFSFLGLVSNKTNIPVLATWTSGLLAAILSLLLPLDSLVQMMSIGTLMAYTCVSVSVLILRYQKDQVGYAAADIHEDLSMVRDTSELSEGTLQRLEAEGTFSEDTGLLRVGENVNVVKYVPSEKTSVFKRVESTEKEENGEKKSRKELVEEVRTKQDQEILKRMAGHMSNSQPTTPPEGSTYQRIGSNYSLNSIGQLFNLGEENVQEPTEYSRRIAVRSIAAIIVVWLCFCALSVKGLDYVLDGAWWALLLLILFVICIIVLITCLARQPRNQTRLSFTVPFVPMIPLASVMINIYLMMTLSDATWWRFFIWMIVGTVIYVGYGMHHSHERKCPDDQQVILYDVGECDGFTEHR